ncbi:MAG: outer membrane protein assembly factor BamD [Bacteroidales bacterium]|nr:outer membrane protein assembly factor BamD [Bacteroidales bacterium]
MLKNRFFLSVIICLLGCVSCSKYNKLLKGTDNEAKYEAALKYYEKKNYDRALQLFDVMQAYYRTKPEGENIAYLTAECYYYKKEYIIASSYYKRFVTRYPISKHAEEALYKSALCYYTISPKSTLDQTDSYTAIDEFQNFIDVFPNSDKVADANARIDTLRVKLEEKQYDICNLYFKMEEYQAAITSYETYLRDYPTSVHREEILNNMVINYYRYAENSVKSKQRERYELALEKYNTLCYVFPDSEYIEKLEPTVKKVRERLEKYKSN